MLQELDDIIKVGGPLATLGVGGRVLQTTVVRFTLCVECAIVPASPSSGS